LCPGPCVHLRSGALLDGRVGDEATDGGVVHLGVHPGTGGRSATNAPTGNADCVYWPSGLANIGPSECGSACLPASTWVMVLYATPDYWVSSVCVEIQGTATRATPKQQILSPRTQQIRGT
jgi:hypothetical protein